MAEHVVRFDLERGTFGAVYSDEIAEHLDRLTSRPTETRRAGDVWANSWGQWWATIAEWVPGGARTFGPFKLYRDAVAAEIAYLKEIL